MIEIYEKSGKQIDPLSLDLHALGAVHQIVVSGTELSKIINTFKNTPHHLTEEPQVWCGEWAQYIAANLLLTTQANRKGLTALNSDGESVLNWNSKQQLAETSLDIISNVAQVHSSYEEMPWICSRTANVPFVSDALVQIWCGSMAQFLVGQLPASDGQQI